MQLPFNELSLNVLNSSDNIVCFYKQLEKIVDLLKLEQLPNVIFKSDFASIDINGLGNIYDVIKSSDLTLEQESVLFSIIQNTPYIDEGAYIPYEIIYNGHQTLGFLYSHHHDKIAISIPHANWSDFTVDVIEQKLCSETGNVVTNKTSIKHVGNLDNYQHTWFKDLVPTPTFNTSDEFLTYFYDTYSKIILSKSSIEYLTNLNLTKLRKLKRSLDILEKYCKENWKFGRLRYSVIKELGLNARPESESTMQLFGYQRNFKNEKNEDEMFTIHFDVSESERAYIKGVDNDRTIYIAYMGQHLSTKKFSK